MERTQRITNEEPKERVVIKKIANKEMDKPLRKELLKVLGAL